MSMNQQVLLRLTVKLVLLEHKIMYRSSTVDEIVRCIRWEMLHTEADIEDAILFHYMDVERGVEYEISDSP